MIINYKQIMVMWPFFSLSAAWAFYISSNYFDGLTKLFSENYIQLDF